MSMINAANKRNLKVISSAANKALEGSHAKVEKMLDFAAVHKHRHRVTFVHPSHWLLSAKSSLPAKPDSAILRPAVSLGLSSFSVRHAHNDMVAPDFSHYRPRSTSSPELSSSHEESRGEDRKAMRSALAGAFLMGGAMSVKGIVHPIIQQWSPAANVLALAQIEINKSDVAPGTNRTFKWRGKPLFVRRRTQEEIDAAKSVDLNQLKDPEHDDNRVKDPEWLVVLGVCTHLGCVPISHQGAYNGYYCPCHGSHYDTSGRIRQGPAPLNLEVPEHSFEEDKLVVG